MDVNLNQHYDHVNSDIVRKQMQWDLFVDKFSSIVCLVFFLLCVFAIAYVVITA